MLFQKLATRNATNAFITNQTFLDAIASFSLITFRALQRRGALDKFDGSLGLFLCWIFNGHRLMVMAIFAAQAGLMVITLERYVKIVHPVWHRNHYRPWMTRIGLVVPLLNGFVFYMIPQWATISAINGRCQSQWPSLTMAKAYRVFLYVWQFVLPVQVFVFCYWKIIGRIRGHKKVAAVEHSASVIVANPSTSMAAFVKREDVQVGATMIQRQQQEETQASASTVIN